MEGTLQNKTAFLDTHCTVSIGTDNVPGARSTRHRFWTTVILLRACHQVYSTINAYHSKPIKHQPRQ